MHLDRFVDMFAAVDGYIPNEYVNAKSLFVPGNDSLRPSVRHLDQIDLRDTEGRFSNAGRAV